MPTVQTYFIVCMDVSLYICFMYKSSISHVCKSTRRITVLSTSTYVDLTFVHLFNSCLRDSIYCNLSFCKAVINEAWSHNVMKG